jgi:hypothetical protein
MKRLIGVFGVLAAVASAPVAKGAIQIAYDVGGGPVICANVAASTGPATCPVVAAGGVSIQVLSANSNSPGTPSLAQQFGASLIIQTGAVGATLDVYFAAQDFLNPSTPPAIRFSSNNSITATTGIGTVDLTSCIDTTNALTPPTNLFCSAGTSVSNPQLAYNGVTGVGNSANTIVNSLVTPPAYSLTQHLHIVLGANSNLNVITSSVLTPVPEPMSIVLLSGVVLLTGRLIRRKYTQRA